MAFQSSYMRGMATAKNVFLTCLHDYIYCLTTASESLLFVLVVEAMNFKFCGPSSNPTRVKGYFSSLICYALFPSLRLSCQKRSSSKLENYYDVQKVDFILDRSIDNDTIISAKKIDSDFSFHYTVFSQNIDFLMPGIRYN